MTVTTVCRWLVRLHPRSSRERFGAEMLCVYDEADRGERRLLLSDGVASLARHWVARSRCWVVGVAVVGAVLQLVLAGTAWLGAALRALTGWLPDNSPGKDPSAPHSADRESPMNYRICAVFCLTLNSPAQSPDARPHFDFASVKRNLSGCEHGRGGGPGSPPPGRLRVSCITVKDLMQAAYGTFASGATGSALLPDVVGAPDWISTDLYDMEAVPSSPQSVDRIYGPMMRSLLEERFGLRIRREARDRSVYLLSVNRGGARLDPAAPGSCVVFDPAHPPEQLRLARCVAARHTGERDYGC